MTGQGKPGPARRAPTVARYGLVGLSLLVGACRTGEPPTEETTATPTAAPSVADGGPATGRIGSCLLADLTIGLEPGEGAGGHATSLIAFRNDGAEPCELVDPIAVETNPVTNPPIERGRLFIPVERFQGDLAAGAAAYVALETTTCPTGGGSSIESVTVSFEDDTVISLPWAVASSCGTRWEGFVSWR